MTDLLVLTSTGSDALRQFEVRRPIGSTVQRPKYSKVCRRGSFVLSVQGDQPVDAYVYDSPEFSLICRTDILTPGSEPNSVVSKSPAAYLADLYKRQSDTFVRGLRGSFAIVLCDHSSRVLKVWTDHFGIERVVYTERQDFMAASTDLRELASLLNERPEIDLSAIREYVQHTCIPTPKTIHAGMYKLAPGHQLTYSGKVVLRPYWDMTYNEDKARGRDEDAWADATFSAVRSAVSLNLASLHGPQRAGCFLSGGTDSSSVAGLVGQLTGAAPRTFSIGFDDPRYNEIEYARLAAKRFRADHHEYFVKPADILSLAQTAATVYDEPFGNSSIVPTYFCARLAAEHGVTHLLAGDGGDELFGGNSRYAADRIFQRYSLIPAWLRRYLLEPVISAGSAYLANAFFSRALNYVRRSNIKTPDRYLSYSLASSVPADELFTRDFLAAMDGEHPLEPARRHFRAAPSEDELNRWLYLDLKITITDNDVRKVTTMSRLAGVTTRYPLLDPTLAEFTGTIPAHYKVRGTQLRYLFKKAMQGILPQEIITKTKHGFGLPYSVWLAENKELRDFTFDVLGSAVCRQRGYFRQDLLEWLWSQYETVHRGFYGDVLWHFLMLELWRLAHDSSASRSPEQLIPMAGLN